ncbi:hypothetical protein OG235_37045 [Streptomyces sp. NBC_00024]|uniref:hypothetical protein n=1 Tax=Streptomyces sp. NBC_00024 TaxID=2903612 RepID=UPI00325060A9
MSNRHQGLRGAAVGVTPLVVLRCAALLAVLMWVLPLCAHASDEAFGVAPAASAPGGANSTGGAVRPATAHGCPGMEHGPGDAHCRPAAGAVTSAASSVPVPSLPDADVTVTGWAPNSPTARGAPAVLVLTPGIHHLQIQRI